MFPAGTKVYVHSSSITGKKLGPKAHSLGYVSVRGQAHYTSRKSISHFPIKGQDFILSPMQIIFTRYGREQRGRIEARSFLNVIPAFVDASGINIRERVAEVLEVLQKDFSSNYDWKHTAGAFGCAFAGTLLPIRNINSCAMDLNEVKAWFTALVRCPEYAPVVAANRNLITFKNLHKINSNLYLWVSKAASSSSALNSIFDWAEDEDENLEALIHFTRITQTCLQKRRLLKDLSMKSFGSNDSFMTWFTRDMFTEDTIMNQKYKATSGMGLSNAQRNFTDCMRLVRNIYLNSKPKYV
jgi:hypothetical protein